MKFVFFRRPARSFRGQARKISGRVTIGKGAVIGGNVWITADVAPGSRVLQQPPGRSSFENGAGI